jgi:nucleoside-diphosphate-sugar epimerase
MRVLMTGAGGQIGSRIHPLLRDRFELRLADVKPINNEPDVHVADIANLHELAPLMEGVDAVMHLAIASGRDFRNRQDEFGAAQLDVNVKGTYNVLEAARRQGVGRDVNASSVMTDFGYPPGRYIAATDPPCADSLYAATKYMGEVLGELYSRLHGLSVICWRIGSPVDPAIEPKGWMRSRAIHEKGLLVSYTDLANGFAVAVEAEGVTYGVFPLVSDNADCYLDATAARHALGYEPVHRFTPDGVETLRDWP